jgi:hypothetical protein
MQGLAFNAEVQAVFLFVLSSHQRQEVGLFA